MHLASIYAGWSSDVQHDCSSSGLVAAEMINALLLYLCVLGVTVSSTRSSTKFVTKERGKQDELDAVPWGLRVWTCDRCAKSLYRTLVGSILTLHGLTNFQDQMAAPFVYFRLLCIQSSWLPEDTDRYSCYSEIS